MRRWVAAALALAGAVWSQAGMAAAGPGSGLTISPVYQDVSLAKDQSSARYTVTLTNNSGVSQTFKFEAKDFGSLDESGGVAFLGDSTSDFEKAHGLANWVTLDKDSATVPAGGQVQIGMTVSNAESLASGGHYAALEAEAQTAPTDAAKNSRVGITQVLSSLLFLLKDGSAPPNLRLVDQTLGSRGDLSLPASANERFLDDGAVHVVPRGTVTIQDPLGRQVMRGALNEGSGIILPGSFRRYQTPLVQLASAWLPGRYTATTVYRYDGTSATQTAQVVFWYAGAWWLWVAAALVVALLGLVVWWLASGRPRWWRRLRHGAR